MPNTHTKFQIWVAIWLSHSNNNIDNLKTWNNIKIIIPNSIIFYVESKQIINWNESKKIINQPKIIAFVRTWFRLLAQRVSGLKPKTAQNNKFVENGLENWALVNQIIETIGFDVKERKITEVY